MYMDWVGKFQTTYALERAWYFGEIIQKAVQVIAADVDDESCASKEDLNSFARDLSVEEDSEGYVLTEVRESDAGAQAYRDTVVEVIDEASVHLLAELKR